MRWFIPENRPRTIDQKSNQINSIYEFRSLGSMERINSSCWSQFSALNEEIYNDENQTCTIYSHNSEHKENYQDLINELEDILILDRFEFECVFH